MGLMQLPLKPHPNAAPTLEKGRLHWYPQYLDVSEADQLYKELVSQIPWRHEAIWLFGKKVMQPRLTAWIADEGIAIRYSGISMTPQPWIASLESLRQRLSAQWQVPFNGVLCNLYQSGQDSMGWHADDEPYLGPCPIIPSLSLGDTRIFQIKPKDPRSTEKTESIALTHGSLLVMAGETQDHYKHQIPKTTKPIGPRINLTFRHIIY